MNFNALVQTIADIHQRAHAGASKAINAALTLRNWLIGAHIHEYELQGQDRATYGDRLIGKLSGSLLELGVPSCERVRLYSYLNFYRAYPQISETISSETSSTGFDYRQFPIVRSLTEQSLENPYDEKHSLKQTFCGVTEEADKWCAVRRNDMSASPREGCGRRDGSSLTGGGAHIIPTCYRHSKRSRSILVLEAQHTLFTGLLSISMNSGRRWKLEHQEHRNKKMLFCKTLKILNYCNNY